jgi:hypothetical protein
MITVPQGGSIAGRSADVRIERPDLGGFVSQVGSAVAQKMGQIKDQQRSVVVEKTKLDMTKEQGEAYQRVSQLTDPAEIETAWATEQTALREKYVAGKDAAGNPLLTPEEADALTLTFDGLATKHGFALGERTIKLTESQQAAAWSAARLDIVNTAATADPDTMSALVEYGEAAIDRLPGLLPDQKQAQKEAFRAEVTNARATTALDQDPTAFITAAEAGTYDALGAERVAQLKVTAQAEADRRAAADAKAGEAETKKRDDAIGKRLDTIADLALKGRLVEDEKFLSDPEIQSHPDFPKAKAAVELRKEVPNLDVMTVAQLDAQITAEEKRPITETWQNERLTVLRSMRDKKAEALATDPKAALSEAGLPAPEIPDFDPADPGTFAAALSEAVSFDGWQREQGYSDQSAIFTKDQKATLKAVLAPGADAGPKVALMGAILEGTKGNASAVLADLEADPVSRRALKVLGVTRDTQLTEAILRGGQKLDGKTVVPPSRKEQILAFDEMTGGVFDDAPALKAELMEATLALYADGAKGIDGETQTAEGWISDGAAYTLYQQSVQRLLGAQADRNGDLTVGGLQEINGGLTVLPVGVGVRDVEDSWDRLTDQLNGVVFDPTLAQTGDMAGADPSALREGFSAPVPDAGDPLRAFKAASLYGGAPDLGSNPSQRFGALTLRRLGETDVYELVYERNGRLMPVPEQGSGNAYRFRLKDLMREARK